MKSSFTKIKIYAKMQRVNKVEVKLNICKTGNALYIIDRQLL